MVKVSVVIPVYNAERHINQCLNSLLNQSLKEIEIICVDDGSSDRSVEIINEYAKKDSRVKLIKQKNAYAGVARNNGMKIAQGEYMMFLDADDFFEPDMLKSMYEKSVDANADVCLCSGRRYNEKSGEYLSTTNFLEVKWLPEEDVFSSTDIRKHVFNIVSPAPWTKMFKREYVKANGLKFQATKKSNDLFFTYTNLALAKTITYVNEEFVNYRIENDASLQGQKKFTYDYYNAFLALKRELTKRGVFKNFEQSFVNRAIGSCFYELDRIEEEDVFAKVLEDYKNTVFYNLCILGHTRGYFYNKANFDRVLKIYSTDASILWEEKQKRLAAAKRPLVDIKNWISPIELKEDGKVKVSVIIPVYNTEDYIGECIESVINSTLRDIEIICVDDGSQDRSLEILNSYAEKDGRIKVIAKENGGPSQARNVALDIAQGEYISFLDSDDYFEPYALEYLYCEAKANDLDDLFFSAETFADSDAHNVANFNYLRKAEYNGVMTGKEMFIIMSDNAEFKPPACFQLVKRSFIEENKIKFVEGIFYEDNAFTMECCFHAKRTRYDHINLYNRRLRDGSTMTTTDGIQSSYKYFRAIKEIQRIADEKNFASDKKFYAAFLEQLQRMCFVSADLIKYAKEDEIMDFIMSLDEKSGIDYFFYVKTSSRFRKSINNIRRPLYDQREKELMTKYKKQCEELKQNQNSENLSAKKKIKRKLKRLYKKLRKILKKILG